jgi:hypothetical protein
MPADPHALTCPCSCHGHGHGRPCDMDGGCGHLHGRPVAEYAALGSHCPGCRRPVRDGLRCVACTDRMTSDLEDVPWLVTELDLTRSRQDRIGESGARGGTHVPLGYRPMAAEVADVLGLTLASAARDLALTGRAPRADVPTDPTLLAGWLLDQREALRWEHVIADEVRYAVGVTRRAIDRPPERVYLGPCDRCTHDLYASPGDPAVRGDPLTRS